MVRRLGVRRAALVAALFVIGLGGCDEDPAAPVSDITSTSAPHPDGHAHRATVRARDIENPPANVTYVTTRVRGHTHGVELLESDLVVLQQSGGTVQVLTSEDEGHSHEFLFTR